MSYNIKSKYLVIAILIALCGIFFGGWYVGAKKVKTASEASESALRDTIWKLHVQINDTEYTLTKTEQELISERQLRKQDIIDKETLKAIHVKHVTEISKLKLRIDTLLEDIGDNGTIITVDTVFVSDSTHKAILLPFMFAKTDKWLDLKGRFDDNGKLGIDLKMDMDVDVVAGVAKSGERTVNILTDNPYIGVIGVRSYKTDIATPKRYGLGIFIGYGVTKSGLSPVVAGGLSYNFIRF